VFWLSDGRLVATIVPRVRGAPRVPPFRDVGASNPIRARGDAPLTPSWRWRGQPATFGFSESSLRFSETCDAPLQTPGARARCSFGATMAQPKVSGIRMAVSEDRTGRAVVLATRRFESRVDRIERPRDR
jgi:hypothetical protein